MAMTFTASNSVNVTGWAALHICTITLWVKFNTLNASGSNRLMGSDDEWEIRATTDWDAGVWKFANELWSSTATQPSPARSTTTVTTNVWYHLACTVTGSGTSHTGILYLNGAQQGSGTSADTTSGTTLSIGNRFGAASGSSTNGILDDVRIYNRVLSADEILTIYSCLGKDDIVQGLVNRWRLNEGGEGVTASGASSIRDDTGTLNGSPVSSPVYAGSIVSERTDY